MIAISLNFKDSTIIIPNVNKSQIQAANSICLVSKGLTALVINMAIRAQISASLPRLTKSDIQQLESVKWNARQIAKSPNIRAFAASLVIAQTYNYEFENIKNISLEEVNIHAISLVQELIGTPFSPGNKILPLCAIKDHNLKSHRLGLMAQKIGSWQAKPLFDPTSIIKNIPVTTITPEILIKQVKLLHEQFEIELDDALLSENFEESFGLTTIMYDSVYCTYDDLENHIIFNDFIRLKSYDNKTPLERIVPFTERSFPIDFNTMENLPVSFLSNPLIKYASYINETSEKEISNNERNLSVKQLESLTPKLKFKSKVKVLSKIINQRKVDFDIKS